LSRYADIEEMTALSLAEIPFCKVLASLTPLGRSFRL
jgi:hypothetical protein